MDRKGWGCDVCRAELLELEFVHLRLRSEARTTYLQVYQCDVCGQWYEWDLSGRIYDRSPEQASASMTRIEEGL